MLLCQGSGCNVHSVAERARIAAPGSRMQLPASSVPASVLPPPVRHLVTCADSCCGPQTKRGDLHARVQVMSLKPKTRQVDALQ
jgi:hypothetical protein